MLRCETDLCLLRPGYLFGIPGLGGEGASVLGEDPVASNIVAFSIKGWDTARNDSGGRIGCPTSSEKNGGIQPMDGESNGSLPCLGEPVASHSQHTRIQNRRQYRSFIESSGVGTPVRDLERLAAEDRGGTDDERFQKIVLKRAGAIPVNPFGI